MRLFVTGFILGGLVLGVGMAFGDGQRQSQPGENTSCRLHTYAERVASSGGCRYDFEVVTRVDEDGTVYCSRTNILCN